MFLNVQNSQQIQGLGNLQLLRAHKVHSLILPKVNEVISDKPQTTNLKISLIGNFRIRMCLFYFIFQSILSSLGKEKHVTPKFKSAITTESTIMEEKTENRPDEKGNMLPMTQMPSPIKKGSFCMFMILDLLIHRLSPNAIRCPQFTETLRNNHIEKDNKTKITPKPKLSSSIPKRTFCRVLLLMSTMRCHPTIP